MMNEVRAAAHVHSDWSYDGSWTLARIAATFARLRYDVVLLAEHDRGFDVDRWARLAAACRDASTPNLLLVPGLEYSDPTNSVHVPVWGDIPFLGAGLETDELLARVQDTGAFATLAHIGRRNVWQRIEASWLARLGGVELWNRKYDGYAPCPASHEILTSHPDLVPFVSLDFHTARQLHPLAMILELDGQATPSRVFDALTRRRARPTAFGLPALPLAAGVSASVLRGAERARSRAAPRLAPLRHRG